MEGDQAASKSSDSSGLASAQGQRQQNQSGDHELTLVSETPASELQRAYESLVKGQLQKLSQCPSFSRSAFLQDFHNFCKGETDGEQQLVTVVDSQHSLPLLYWSLFSPFPHLTTWCLTMMLDQVGKNKTFLESTLSAAVAAVLFTPPDDDSRCEARKLLKRLTRMEFNADEQHTLKLVLPFPTELETEERKTHCSEIQSRLESTGVHYLDKPSLPIDPSLLSLAITEDAVSVELPSQQWRLVLKVLADSDVDETDQDGNTLLYLAAQIDCLEAIKLAVKSGASLNVKNNEGVRPFELNQLPGDDEQPPTVRAVFHDKIIEGDIEYVKVALCRGASLSSRGFLFGGPLHTACKADQREAASLLIELGTAIDAVDDDGLTPLHMVCTSGFIESARLLLQRGANTEVGDRNGEAPLHIACNAEIAQLLLDHHANISAQSKIGCTPLHLACRSGRIEVAELLIQHQADIEAGMSEGSRPLHLACEVGETKMASVLLQHRANILGRNGFGCMPLHRASECGYVETVTLLLESGAEIEAGERRNCTPLHLACLAGHLDVAVLLLERGAKVNAKNRDQFTPLHYAAYSRNEARLELTKLLIKHGADVNAETKFQFTPLHFAVEKGNTEVCAELIQHKADLDRKNFHEATALHVASGLYLFDTVKLLIDSGASLNEQDEHERTPLFCACAIGKVDSVRYLLQANIGTDNCADVHVVDEYRQTALHAACYEGHSEAVELLLPHYDDVTMETDSGRSPLQIACFGLKRGHAHIVELLFKHKSIDPNHRDRFGRLPLHLTSGVGNTDTMKFLINDYGADVNDRDKNKCTALHHACKCGHPAPTSLLVKYNADVTIADSVDQTPLHYACLLGRTDLVKIFLEKTEADINAVDSHRRTPLQWATAFGRVEVVTLLLQHKADKTLKDDQGLTPLEIARVEFPGLIEALNKGYP